MTFHPPRLFSPGTEVTSYQLFIVYLTDFQTLGILVLSRCSCPGHRHMFHAVFVGVGPRKSCCLSDKLIEAQ